MTVKISNLPAATSVGSGDVLPVVQSGTTKKIDLNSPWSINIDGGNIDGTPIGVSSASSGAFTTLTASDDVNFDSGTLFVDASASAVGIGVTSPSGKLHVSGTDIDFYLSASRGTGTDYSITSSGSNGQDFQIKNETLNRRLYLAADDEQSWYIGGNEAMRIDSSGNVGIGVTSPSGKLHVYEGSSSGANISSSYNNIVVEGDSVSGLTFANTTSGAAAVAWADSGGSDRGYVYYRHSDDHLQFGTASTERMRIDSSGRVGIGETSPAVKLDVRTNTTGNYACRMQNQNSSNPFGLQVFYTTAINSTGSRFFDCEDVSALRMSVRSNGGIANYQANDVNLSDERVKKDIQPLPSYWQKIKEIEIVQFKYKDQTHDDINIGVIAQQVETVAPEFVDDDGFGKTPDDGVPLKSIYTADLYHAAIKGLQEAMHRIEKLEAKLDELKGA